MKALQGGLDPYDDLEQNHLPLFVERSSPCPLRVDTFTTSSDEGYFAWEAFEGHQWRISDLSASAESESDLLQILRGISQLKRLERLKLKVDYTVSTKDLDLRVWKTKNHPHLRHLEITPTVFCRAITVPSLHTLILDEFISRDVESLPGLLRALKKCPALITFHLRIESKSKRTTALARVDVVDLPKLRKLRVAGDVSAIHTFLSYISFLVSAARIELVTIKNDNTQ